MNKEEYWSSKNHNKTIEDKTAHEKLKEWKQANNITERCVIHHRDDTEECIKYNSEHYERWGYNEDGTFEYGKYVVFMTRSEHCTYHHMGEKNPFWGKRHTDETKRLIGLKSKGRPSAFKGCHHTDETNMKNRIAHLGKHHTDEARQKMSDSKKERMQIISSAYKEYKSNGGILMWNDFQKQYATANLLNASYGMELTD